MSRDLSRLRLGTATDSWGVWFAQDPQQVGWKQYLDDVAVYEDCHQPRSPLDGDWCT